MKFDDKSELGDVCGILIEKEFPELRKVGEKQPLSLEVHDKETIARWNWNQIKN